MVADDENERGFTAKLTDFGFSRFIPENTLIKTMTHSTVTHMPPELLEHGEAQYLLTVRIFKRMRYSGHSAGIMSPALDIFSFGVLMWEMFAADHVYKVWIWRLRLGPGPRIS